MLLKHIERGDSMKIEAGFADRLRQVREEKGVSYAELSKQLKNIPAPTLHRYEKEEREPKWSQIKAIAEMLCINPLWLMGYDVDRYDLPAKTKLLWKKIPVLGTIAAGTPIIASENVIGYEQVPHHDKADFCLVVKGDSMTGARILEGDTVFIHQQPEVENGEIAAVLIDGEEATLKRFYKMDGIIILKSENPAYQDMIFSKKDSKTITIIGKAVEFKSEVK